jgi:O-antigen/teichoic acid export membrane protein
VRILLKGFFYRAVYLGIAFVISLLIARLSGAAGFGAVSLMIVNAALIQILSGLGTDSAILIQGVSSIPADRDKIFSFTVYTSLLQILLFTAAANISWFYFGKTLLSGGHDLRIFFIEFVYFAGLVLTEKYSSLFYSQQKAAFCNKLLAHTIFILLLVLLGLLLFQKEYIAAHPATVMAGITFIPAVVLLIVYHTGFRPVLRKPDKAGILAFTTISLIALVTNLVQFIAYRVDFWLIDYYHTKNEVGVYAQAAKFAQVIWIIPNIMATLFIPALKQQKNPLSVAALFAFNRVFLTLHILLALFLVLGSYILYSSFLPPAYMSGFRPLLLMLPGYIFFIITIILSSWFAANKMLTINLLGSLLCCVLMVAGDLILIPKYSYRGAALANLIAYSLTSVYYIWIMRRQMKTELKNYFGFQQKDWRDIFRQNDELN